MLSTLRPNLKGKKPDKSRTSAPPLLPAAVQSQLVLKQFGLDLMQHVPNKFSNYARQVSTDGNGSRWKSTPVGFEPTRGDPIRLAGRRLNHSAKVSLLKTISIGV